MSLDMYAEELIYRYEHPQNKGKVEGSEATTHEENISCGDKIDVYLKVSDGKIDEIKFEGNGCVIAMGTADIVAENLKGKKIEDIEKMGKEDVLKMISIDPGPVRMHCATLAMRAIKKAILAYENKPIDTKTKEL